MQGNYRCPRERGEPLSDAVAAALSAEQIIATPYISVKAYQTASKPFAARSPRGSSRRSGTKRSERTGKGASEVGYGRPGSLGDSSGPPANDPQLRREQQRADRGAA